MSLKVYRRVIQEEIKAVKYEGKESDDLLEMLKIIKGLYFYKYNQLYIRKCRNNIKVNKNDYIILHTNGDVTVLPEFEFEMLYIKGQE